MVCFMSALRRKKHDIRLNALNIELYGYVTTIQFSENIKPVSMHT